MKLLKFSNNLFSLYYFLDLVDCELLTFKTKTKNLALESLFEPSYFIKVDVYTQRKPNNLAKVLQQSGARLE